MVSFGINTGIDGLGDLESCSPGAGLRAGGEDALYVDYLTWAKCNVAELRLLLRALTGIPTKLRLLAGASPVPVSPPARRRAQAPWRPLIPGPVHCNGNRGSDCPFQQSPGH